MKHKTAFYQCQLHHLSMELNWVPSITFPQQFWRLSKLHSSIKYRNSHVSYVF